MEQRLNGPYGKGLTNRIDPESEEEKGDREGEAAILLFSVSFAGESVRRWTPGLYRVATTGYPG